MPVTRCPYCALRMAVEEQVVGQVVGCTRCGRTFPAHPQTRVSRVGELMLVLAALATGAIVGWLILRARGG